MKRDTTEIKTMIDLCVLDGTISVGGTFILFSYSCSMLCWVGRLSFGFNGSHGGANLGGEDCHVRTYQTAFTINIHLVAVFAIYHPSC